MPLGVVHEPEEHAALPGEGDGCRRHEHRPFLAGVREQDTLRPGCGRRQVRPRPPVVSAGPDDLPDGPPDHLLPPGPDQGECRRVRIQDLPVLPVDDQDAGRGGGEERPEVLLVLDKRLLEGQALREVEDAPPDTDGDPVLPDRCRVDEGTNARPVLPDHGVDLSLGNAAREQQVHLLPQPLMVVGRDKIPGRGVPVQVPGIQAEDRQAHAVCVGEPSVGIQLEDHLREKVGHPAEPGLARHEPCLGGVDRL